MAETLEDKFTLPEPPFLDSGLWFSEQVGEGGMGVVYKGRDELERDVAIKVILPKYVQDARRMGYFENEARLLAAVAHPNIATIHRLARLKSGARAIVMEMVRGVTLRNLLASRHPSREETVRWVGQIASALHAAHVRRIIHRDLKPSNVIIQPDGSAKVLDFGLAMRLAGTDHDDDSSTETGDGPAHARGCVGTAGYASPEQVRGEDVDERTDVFALGCIFFECLTGRRAFDGSDDPGRNDAVLHGEPDWNLLPADVQPGLRLLLQSMLKRDRDQRTPWACDEIVELLRKISSDSVVMASAISLPAGLRHAPRYLTSFIGRIGALRTLDELMQSRRLVNIRGQGGCGKTRLATVYGWSAAANYRDGAVFVDLSPITDEKLVVSTIAERLGAQHRGGSVTESPLKTVTEALKDKNLLLILDNCENDAVANACRELIPSLLAACPQVKVLTTSRDELLPEEQRLPLDALEYDGIDGHATLDRAESLDSVRLFVDRAQLHDPGFALTSDNSSDVVSLCRKLGGVPLQIELVAAWVRLLTPADMLAELDDLSVEMTTVRPDGIQWALGKLTDDERRLATMLSVFSGGFTFATARALCARLGSDGRSTIAARLTRLEGLSLLRSTKIGKAARLEFPPPVRERLRRLLEKSSECAAVRGAHARLMLSVALEGRFMVTWGTRQKEGLDLLTTEHHNLREALRWACSREGSPKLGLLCCWALHRFWYIRSHWAEGIRWLQATLKAYGDRRTVLRGRALHALAFLELGRQRHEQAAELSTRAIEIFRERACRLLLMMAVNNRSIALHNLGRFSEAAVDRGEVRQIMSAYTRGRRFVMFKITESAAALLERDYAKAGNLLEECRAEAQRLADRHLLAVWYTNSAEADIGLGHPREALPKLATAAELRCQVDDQLGCARTYLWAARAAADLGAIAESSRLLGAAEARRRTVAATWTAQEKHEAERVQERSSATLGKGESDSSITSGATLTHAQLAELIRRLGCA